MATEQEIITAIENNYPGHYKFDGWLVINKHGTIQAISGGALDVFVAEESKTINSNIARFLPENMLDRHQALIQGEFNAVLEAAKNPDKKPYRGRIMGAPPTEKQARFFPARTWDRQNIKVGIEFQPLLCGKDVFMIAFITAGQNVEHVITQDLQADRVIKNMHVELGFSTAERAGNMFARAHNWLVENVTGGNKTLGFLVEIAILVLLSFGGLVGYETVRGHRSFQQFNISAPGLGEPTEHSSQRSN